MKKDKLFSQIKELGDRSILLHSIGDRDVDQLFLIYSNQEIFRYCGILNKRNKDTVRKMIPHFDRDFRKQQRIKWGICIKDTDQLCGIIEVMDIGVGVNSATIGYYLNPEVWNRGIARAAVGLLIDYLFNEIEVNRIAAYVMPENRYSKRVLLGNGFLREGLIREGSVWPGKGVVDLELYSILRREFRKGEGDLRQSR